MKYITVQEASEKWNISARRVCVLCSNGQISGAVKKSKVWMIPDSVNKPEDGRKRTGETIVDPFALLYNFTYFENNGITPTSPEEVAICEAQEQFMEGKLDEAYDLVCKLILTCEKRYELSFKVLKMCIVADMGNMSDYKKGLLELNAFIGDTKECCIEKKICSLLLYPKEMQFFQNEEKYDLYMPLISMSNAKRSLNSLIQSEDYGILANLEIICHELEEKNCPLVSAYYHIFLAVYYNAVCNMELFNFHIGKALEICIPRKWYTPLAEYSATIDFDFLAGTEPEAYKRISELSGQILRGFAQIGIFEKLHNKPKLDIETNVRVAYLVAQGKSNNEIAEKMGLSIYKVRQHVNDLYLISGSNSKSDFKRFFLQNFFV